MNAKHKAAIVTRPRRFRNRTALSGWSFRPPEASHRTGQHIRHAKIAADLDQLAARNDDFAARRKAPTEQERRRRAIIDDQSSFRTGQFRKSSSASRTATAAFSGFEVIFEVRITRGVRSASRARSESGARPRFVWITTPGRIYHPLRPCVFACPNRYVHRIKHHLNTDRFVRSRPDKYRRLNRPRISSHAASRQWSARGRGRLPIIAAAAFMPSTSSTDGNRLERSRPVCSNSPYTRF